MILKEFLSRENSKGVVRGVISRESVESRKKSIYSPCGFKNRPRVKKIYMLPFMILTYAPVEIKSWLHPWRVEMR